MTKKEYYYIIYLNSCSNIKTIGGDILENKISDMCCDCIHAHTDTLDKVMKTIPKDETLCDLAELYKVFGDSTRIKILYVLYKSELCVCDIASLLNMTISAISHQLKILKTANLVKSRKSGRTVFYSLSDNHVSMIISQGMEHINE